MVEKIRKEKRNKQKTGEKDGVRSLDSGAIAPDGYLQHRRIPLLRDLIPFDLSDWFRSHWKRICADGCEHQFDSNTAKCQPPLI